jgi:2,4-dienoyl-CoA reductase (NADPH2)
VDGLPTARQAYYYAERAKGGAGLIITEEHSVHPSDWPYQKLIHAYRPEVIPGYKQITSMVHRYDTRIFAQLNHNGGQSWGIYSQLPVWAPSAIPDPLFREVPKEIELEEIAAVVAGYAKVAKHVREGQFDGLELQGSHSSLIRQFLSPQANRRTDEYGGSLENRMRFLREIVIAIRSAVGRDFPLGVRLCGDEMIDGGLQLDEATAIARALANDGLVDYLNTSIGTATHTLFLVIGSMSLPLGYAQYISSAFRQATNLPVIAVGRIKDPAQAERVLSEGHADLVGMVRAQIADPEFARKAREGDDQIRLCLSCNQGCVGRVGLNLDLGCIENPAAGNEQRWGIGTLQRAATAKRVMVVGGGPAGLKAATVAARRGHQVALYEQSAVLGGQINLSTMVPSRAEFGDLVRNLTRELETLPVVTTFGIEVTPEFVLSEAPDAVVIATGSEAARPAIPGADSPHVCTVIELLSGRVTIGSRVLVIDLVGSHQATTAAEWLAARGHRVQLVSPTLVVGQELGLTLDLEVWRRRAASLGVRCTPDVSVLAIDGRTVRAVHNYSGQEILYEDVDSVVFATPGKANDGLYFALKHRIADLHRIGDCLAPRRADSAILEGERIGRAL